MLAQDCVDDLRDDRVIKPDDAGKERFIRSQPGDKVLTHLQLDRAAAIVLAAKFADRFGACHDVPPFRQQMLRRMVALES